mmetsp:Transcript_7314/g.7474  ORF Transcript_7314/g.7474 Transcript_7314/m.7474 type:complete len:139 (+) Transcript_7314:1141-1557(+)
MAIVTRALFVEIQGLLHLSTILQDNSRSSLVYKDEFNAVSVQRCHRGSLGSTPRLNNFLGWGENRDQPPSVTGERGDGDGMGSGWGGPGWIKGTKAQALVFGAVFMSPGVLVNANGNDSDDSYCELTLDTTTSTSIRA